MRLDGIIAQQTFKHQFGWVDAYVSQESSQSKLNFAIKTYGPSPASQTIQFYDNLMCTMSTLYPVMAFKLTASPPINTRTGHDILI